MSTPRTRRLALAGTAALAAIALLASCAGQSAGTDDAAAGDPVTGGTLTYLEHQAHTTLYPPQAGFYPNGGIVNNITARLTWQDPESLEIEPWVATEWTVNADATEYTFDLRDDVTFSDGTALDAAAVAKNFDTYGLGNKELGLTISEAINNYASSEVVDADTVTFRFSAPAPGFLQATSTINSGLLSPATLDRKLEDFGAGIVDRDRRLGPVRHHRGGDRHRRSTSRRARTTTGRRRRSSTRAAPTSTRSTSIVTPEDSVRIGSLLAGQADVHPLRAGLRRGAGLGRRASRSYAAPTRGVNNSLGLRFTNPLLSDIRVRQALVHGVDAQEVVDTIFTENYPVATSELAATAKGYTDESKALAYDPEQSEELLDDAGWTVGADGIREKDGAAPLAHGLRGQAAAALEADPRAGEPAAREDRRRAEREGRGRRQLRRRTSRTRSRRRCTTRWSDAPTTT